MIRSAKYEDKDRVVKLLHDSHIGAGFDRPDGPTGFVFEFEPTEAERLFLSHLLVGNSAICIVHDVGGVAQGILMAIAAKHKFGSVKVASETAWWIDPSHRGSAAIRMLDFYEKWANEQGCKFVGMAGMGEDPEVMKMYLRRGYRKAETHCLKAV